MPAAIARRIVLELILVRMRGRRTTITSCTSTPSARRLGTFPSPPRPSRNSLPTHRALIPCRARRPATKSAAEVFMSARSNASTSTSSTPAARSRAIRSCSEQMSGRTGRSRTSTASGRGENVTATSRSPRPLASRRARAMSARCPAWTPSNVPTVTTAIASLPPVGAHEAVDIRRVHQVGHRPSVEVVLGQAPVREPLVLVNRASRGRGEQHLEADVLVVTRVVALVQLVAPAELGADRIPQQLHQLHPLDRVIAVGAADVLVEYRPDLRVEVHRVGVQVDQRRPQILFDDLLDPRV